MKECPRRILVFNDINVDKILKTQYVKSKTKTNREIIDSKNKKAICFLDCFNKKIKYLGNMYDLAGKEMPSKSIKPCWWCRHTFDTHPLGCPLKYQDDIFHCEGNFCSFPCVKSFIRDQKSNTRYKNSFGLTSLLYIKLFDSNKNIPFASHWKTLIDYGGFLSIQEFRQLFGDVEYVDTVNTKIYCASQFFSQTNT